MLLLIFPGRAAEELLEGLQAKRVALIWIIRESHVITVEVMFKRINELAAALE